ncbi:MAG: potassium channel protein [Pseudomonadota bacterium]
MDWLRHHPLAPLLRPLFLLSSMFVVGSVGFFVIGAGRYSPLECVYMTVITLTTVGYGDVLHAGESDLGRAYTIVLLITGMGVTLYSVSTITAFIVEGHLRRLFRERAMQRKIAVLKDHYVLCGVGETGIHVMHELIAADVPFVVVEQNLQMIQHAQTQTKHELLHVIGDATHESVLETAGIQRASGLVAVLHEDKDNLFLVITARLLKQDMRIVAKCVDHDSQAKFKRAGANYVVSPAFIGGMRIASQLLRPNVVNFLDNMLRGRDKTIRVDEVIVPAAAGAIGKSLRDLRIGERTGMLVIAVGSPGEEEFEYNPGGQWVLQEGSVLVVIGRGSQAEKLRQLVREG